MAKHRRKKRDSDHAFHRLTESCGSLCGVLSGLRDGRVWTRTLLGYALILAYISFTASLSWTLARLMFGTWGVPQGEGFHGSWPNYLLMLAFIGPILIPMLLSVPIMVSLGAYRLGQMLWPMLDTDAWGS